jgi:hypothetical protein
VRLDWTTWRRQYGANPASLIAFIDSFDARHWLESKIWKVKFIRIDGLKIINY